MVAQVDNRCISCNLCYQNQLDIESFPRFHEPFPLGREKKKKYLTVFFQPNIQMMNSDFDISSKSYGYFQYDKIFREYSDYFPLVRAVENDKRIRKKVSSSVFCREFLFDLIESNNYSLMIVLGFEQGKVFDLEREVFKMLRIRGKYILAINIHSPTHFYYGDSTLIGESLSGNEYYKYYLKLFEEICE